MGVLLLIGDRSKLSHQSQPIKESPELRDLARSDTVEDETGDGDLSSGWGNPLKLPLVRPPTRPPFGNPGSFSHQFVGRRVPVGERASQAGCKNFQMREIDLPHPRENDCRSSSHQFVCCRQIPFVPELLVEKSHQGFILFASHRRFSFSFFLIYGTHSSAASVPFSCCRNHPRNLGWLYTRAAGIMSPERKPRSARHIQTGSHHATAKSRTEPTGDHQAVSCRTRLPRTADRDHETPANSHSS